MSEYRVLLADGNASFRRAAAEFFRTDKDVIRFVEASDGAEALDRLREEHFEVLISELVMPKLDGLDLLEALQAEPSCRPDVLIIVSYMRSDGLLQKAFAKGATYVMLKPVEPEYLHKRMLDLCASGEEEALKNAALNSPAKTLDE